MEWVGQKIKEVAQKQGISLTDLADSIEVSRQTVNSWITGQVPKGNHLVALCRLFGLSPEYFFVDDADTGIIVPVHRIRKNANVTTSMQEASTRLAGEYKLLFKYADKPGSIPVTRSPGKNDETAVKLAHHLRELSGVERGYPLNYQHTFELLKMLGVSVIFRRFSDEIKSYAFFTEIYGHRVVFVNTSTNIIDLIFPLLHETVHAIRDEVMPPSSGYDPEEEVFCDSVASYTQFPDEYVQLVYNAIKGLNTGTQVNKLKHFGTQYKHSLFGITKRMAEISPGFSLDVGGADTNFKKEFPSIGDILFAENDERAFVAGVCRLSPVFTGILLAQLNDVSDRKLVELLGLESLLDGKTVRWELTQFNKGLAG